jgi:hypothetical protein
LDSRMGGGWWSAPASSDRRRRRARRGGFELRPGECEGGGVHGVSGGLRMRMRARWFGQLGRGALGATRDQRDSGRTTRPGRRH